MRAPFLLLAAAVLALSVPVGTAQDKSTKEAAQKKHDDALKETDQTAAVRELCDAAAMVPKNQDFQNECTQARSIIVNRDRKYLITAEDAKKSDPDKAKRYAGYITKIDPDTYAKAQQLLKDMNTPTVATQPQPTSTTPTQAKDQSGALYAQAMADFRSGNLQGAKSTAQQVTDPSLKSLANDLVGQVDRYYASVSEGQRQEAGGHYDQAISSYQSAQAVSRNVSSDNLAGKIDRLQAQIASVKPPATGGTQQANGGSKPTETARIPPPPPGPKPVEPSAEDKKKALMNAYAQAIKSNELESAERALRQVVQLDPRDQSVRSQLDDLQKRVADALNRDPEKLENTLRDAIQAFYASDFDGAESKLNNYLRASGAKKKGAAYFYLGATEEAQGLLEAQAKRSTRLADARDNFKQSRSAGYQPVPKYVSEKIMEAWKQAGL